MILGPELLEEDKSCLSESPGRGGAGRFYFSQSEIEFSVGQHRFGLAQREKFFSSFSSLE
jgi:hypothetical protein